MAISVRNHGMGPSSSNVEDMESCKTLEYKNIFNSFSKKKGKLTRSSPRRFAQRRGWSWPWRSCRSGRTCGPTLACGSPALSSRPRWRWSTHPWASKSLIEERCQGDYSIKTEVELLSDFCQFLLLAFLCGALRLVVAEEELPVEELDADHGEDEQEEDVDDEDVEHILQRDHDAVEDRLEGGHPVDHLERAEDSEQLHRFQLRSRWSSPEILLHLSDQVFRSWGKVKTITDRLVYLVTSILE